jgi:hypothetical protein
LATGVDAGVSSTGTGDRDLDLGYYPKDPLKLRLDGAETAGLALEAVKLTAVVLQGQLEIAHRSHPSPGGLLPTTLTARVPRLFNVEADEERLNGIGSRPDFLEPHDQIIKSGRRPME